MLAELPPGLLFLLRRLAWRRVGGIVWSCGTHPDLTPLSALLVKESEEALYRSLDPVKWWVWGGCDTTRWKDIGCSPEGSWEVWTFMISLPAMFETRVSLFFDSMPVIGRVQQTCSLVQQSMQRCVRIPTAQSYTYGLFGSVSGKRENIVVGWRRAPSTNF